MENGRLILTCDILKYKILNIETKLSRREENVRFFPPSITKDSSLRSVLPIQTVVPENLDSTRRSRSSVVPYQPFSLNIKLYLIFKKLYCFIY